MPFPTDYRRFKLPADHRRAPSDVRTSDMVLAVTFVAVLGLFCLILIGSLVAPAAEISIVPITAQAS